MNVEIYSQKYDHINRFSYFIADELQQQQQGKKDTHKMKIFLLFDLLIDLCVCNIVVWLSSVTIEVIAAFRVKQLFALKLSTQFSK